MSLFGLFQKSKQKSSKTHLYHSQVVLHEKLPDNFAQSLMELQMQLEFVETFNRDVIHKLNNLYSIAIQHYINIDIRKANHFQKKLTNLLSNPITLKIIDQKPQSVKISHNQVSQYANQLKQELNKFNSQSQVVVKSMLQGSDFKAQRTNRIITNNINFQENKFKQRLEQRSKSKSKKVFTLQ